MHDKSTILMNKIFVMLGLSKENFEEDSSDKKKKPAQVQVQANSQMNFIEPPQTSQNVMINSDRGGMPEAPSRKSDYDQQNGIPYYMNEPVAANEVGFTAF